VKLNQDLSRKDVATIWLNKRGKCRASFKTFLKRGAGDLEKIVEEGVFTKVHSKSEPWERSPPREGGPIKNNTERKGN